MLQNDVCRPIDTAEMTASMMGSKPKIVVLLGHYLPGYKAGGPIRSIENLVEALGGEFSFQIITADRDIGDVSAYSSVQAHRWVKVGQAEVMYTRPGIQGLVKTCAMLCSVDRQARLYINSYFHRRFSMLPVLLCWLKVCRPKVVVLAPRGEFSEGALRIKSLRKKVYRGISRALSLHSGVVWHASTEAEAEDIRRHCLNAKSINLARIFSLSAGRAVCQITELITASDLTADTSAEPDGIEAKKPGELKVVFLSRISKMKNLLNALRTLDGLTGRIQFSIYGPIEDMAYWGACLKVIASLPKNVKVRYGGEVKHREVRGILAQNELLLLPTFGENFGHVIAESLAAGCPVLISDQTPWRNLEARSAGWDIPLVNPERFRAVLQRCIDGDQKWHDKLRCGARTVAMEHKLNEVALNAHRRLFL